MPAVARVGDVCTHGGEIKAGASAVFVNGIAVARVGDPVECPRKPDAKIIGGSAYCSVEGSPVARVGDMVDCGGVIASGSQDVFAG